MSQTAQAEKLDATNAGQQVWLVKVPNFVAQAWRAQCEQSKHSQQAQGAELGRVRIETNSDQQHDLSLTLTGTGVDGLPKEYKMRTQTADVAAVHAFAEREGRTSIQGSIVQKFDLEMNQASEEHIDPRYRQLSRARHQQASTKTRVMQVIDDPRSVGMMRPIPVSTASANKRKVARGEKVSDNKRVRIDRDQLEKLLFSLFERQEHWTFSQLLLQTEQPVPWLKEVLADIAVLNKRGLHQNMYELKQEYKSNKADAMEEDGTS
ncbi:hypothetical protein WJX72_001166 [[Myrmecia] bisecta]|uniref:Transcription initiation factor IIF subunit beta n=1 Tax=[Myrmecia] bisecta TaxID=41462 RepID=A0AAW1Q383_9CHLO